MLKIRFILYSLLFLPALLLGLPLGLWAQVTTPVNEGNSENALSRLIEISTQLSSLNERLREELQNSRQSSRELQITLESSKRELEELRQELAVLHSSSTGLLIKAENSQAELTALVAALRKAESSLMSLELSFAAYRESAEGRIKTLEKKNRFWKWGCIAAGILAAGAGTALLVTR